MYTFNAMQVLLFLIFLMQVLLCLANAQINWKWIKWICGEKVWCCTENSTNQRVAESKLCQKTMQRTLTPMKPCEQLRWSPYALKILICMFCNKLFSNFLFFLKYSLPLLWILIQFLEIFSEFLHLVSQPCLQSLRTSCNFITVW